MGNIFTSKYSYFQTYVLLSFGISCDQVSLVSELHDRELVKHFLLLHRRSAKLNKQVGFTLLFIQYTMHSKLYTLQYFFLLHRRPAQFNKQVDCSLKNVYCTFCIVHYTLSTAHCTLDTLHSNSFFSFTGGQPSSTNRQAVYTVH